jgi:hypothetical protein
LTDRRRSRMKPFMEKFSPTPSDSPSRSWMRMTALILGGLLVLRILALLADPNSLYADETQYWLWSRSVDWGYFSKPP